MFWTTPTDEKIVIPPSCNHTSTDAERAAERKRLKRLIAANGLLRRRKADLTTAIDGFERESEAAVARHKTETTTIRDRLAEIEEAVVDAMADGRPANAKLEAEREKLLAKLGDLTSTLERTVEDVKSRTKPLREERAAVQAKMATPEVLDNQLIATAPPELQQKGTALNRVGTTLDTYCKSIDSKRKELKESIASAVEPGRTLLAWRLGNWDQEADLVGKMLVDVRLAAAENRREMLTL
ncbi:hypothetical protein Pla175_05480 [Pirellulimonas nuda]|uniref:Chromosome partition protein Smc n=1 Tax=Pirellulimonas nuda TaxID=2528009 RepID=A0A518D6W0_9BACT|nr:hypothetical protein [Pirellulimonas nuda]QDU87191.1 hypothetical protein Pla175_05480 [Pirellulimonas nuda]